MGNKQYNLNFDKLCEVSNVGKRLSEPIQLKGGLLHRMYCLETTSSKYAVKALNPQIMLRPKAMSDVLNGERIAAIAAQYIPTLSAKSFSGKTVLELDGQYYMVFDWVEGTSLYNENITNAHCEQIGAILGKLHTIDFSLLSLTMPAAFTEETTDWDGYLAVGRQSKLPWVEELSSHKDNLYDWNNRYLAAMKYLDVHLVIGHCDIGPKNVLWCNNEPVVIDWESAGYTNPSRECIVHALRWSDLYGRMNKERFTAFVRGYADITSFETVEWLVVMEAGLGPHWLEYNLKRSLGIESSDAAERQLGTEQVFVTIDYLKRYEASISQIAKLMTQITQ